MKVSADTLNPDRSTLPALPTGFQFGGEFFTLTTSGDTTAGFASPLVLTYRPPAEVVKQAGDLDHVRVALAGDSGWVALPCTTGDGALTCSVSHASVYASLVIPSAVAPLDTDQPGGWFYREANGFGGAGDTGFSVVDDAQAAFWTELQRFGGVNAIGYPITGRFQYQGFTTQAFQKLVLQWRPELNRSVPVNVLDDLNAHGSDVWLDRARQVPPAADTSADAGLSWEQVVARHTSLLDPYPALRSFYDATPGAIDVYGLPLSTKDYGGFVAVRLQRGTLQLWTQADGSQRVAVGNAADVAKEAGLWPLPAITAQVAPPVGAAPTPTPTPVPAPSPPEPATTEPATTEPAP
jgi:hypothetical protein